MRIILCSLIVSASIPGVSFAQDSTSSDVVVHFTVPAGWKTEGDSTFIRSNLAQAFSFWHKELEEGHMPWRGDPKNVAVTCLWRFGIHDGSPVWIFADRLGVIRKGSVYSFTADSTQYIIYVRTKNGIPVADKFTVRELPKVGGTSVGKGMGH